MDSAIEHDGLPGIGTSPGVPASSGGVPPQRTSSLFTATASIAACKAGTVLAASLVAILTARQLGPSGRGVLVLLFTLAPFTAVVCGLGVNLAARVHMVATTNPVLLGEFLGLALVLCMLEAVVCAVVGLVLLPLAGVQLNIVEVAMFGVMGSTLLFQLTATDALNAFGFTVRAAMVEVAGFVLQVVLVVALVLSGIDRFQPYVGVIIVSGWFQIWVAVLSLRRQQLSVKPRYHRGQWTRLVRTGWPSVPSALSQLLTFRADRYLVGVFMSPAAVGVYSVAATVPEFLRVIPMAMAQSVFYRVASGKNGARDFRRATLVSFAGTAALAAVTFLLAPVIVPMVFGPEFNAAVTPLRILLLAETGMTLFYVEGAVLGGLGRLSDGAKAAVVGFAVVLLADVLLIPSYGLVGAAWASVVAYSVMSAVVHGLLQWRPTAAAPDGSPLHAR